MMADSDQIKEEELYYEFTVNEMKQFKSILTSAVNRYKRKREDISVKPEPKVETPPPVQKEEKKKEWVCAGRVWDDPITECPKNNDRCSIKAGCVFEKKKYVICKECKNAYIRMKRKLKKKKTEEN